MNVIVAPQVGAAQLSRATTMDDIRASLPALCAPHHRFDGSVSWRLTDRGVSIDDADPLGTPGQPQTVRRVRDQFGGSIERWSTEFEVPVELIIATICTESGGNPLAERDEPGFVSYDATPGRVSIGLMQTLISTARSALGGLPAIDGPWLLVPDNSICAGTAYIARQAQRTSYDPPVVACAYNAGGIYQQNGPANRWRMRQYPIGTGAHADRFVAWFNDCFKMYEADGGAPAQSFFALLRAGPARLVA
jgi:Transglycosylase SLT domain